MLFFFFLSILFSLALALSSVPAVRVLRHKRAIKKRSPVRSAAGREGGRKDRASAAAGSPPPSSPSSSWLACSSGQAAMANYYRDDFSRMKE